LNIAIVGAGWAGLAAAVSAIADGHQATLFEASSAIGGRARALKAWLPDGSPVLLDNGQHILIGAYTETLKMMRLVGVATDQALLKLPMTLQFPDGRGIRFPDWPTPLDALAGILGARGWSWRDKWQLLRAAAGWQRNGFDCAPGLSVAALCQPLTRRVHAELIEPLCVSALNTPAAQASASVFLRVLRDALFGVAGGSNLLLPKTDLTALFAQPAADWVSQRGGHIHRNARVLGLRRVQHQWQLHLPDAVGEDAPSTPATPTIATQPARHFDAVILATSATHAAQVLAGSGLPAATPKFLSNQPPALIQPALPATTFITNEWQPWVDTARALRFEAIATVYAWAAGVRLPQPMLALRSSATQPAQFVFDRGALGGPAGLLAFVVSAAAGDRQRLQASVLAQAQAQLGLTLQAVQTVVEKRATFACTPGLTRPAQRLAPGLLACGDHVAGPYPATLEGAVISGISAVQALGTP